MSSRRGVEAPRSTSDTPRLAAVVRAGFEAPVRQGSRAALPTSVPTGAVYQTQPNTDGSEYGMVEALGHEIADHVNMAVRSVREYVTRPGGHGLITVGWDVYPDMKLRFEVLFTSRGDRVSMAHYINGEQSWKRVLSSEEEEDDDCIGREIEDWFQSRGGKHDDQVKIEYNC